MNFKQIFLLIFFGTAFGTIAQETEEIPEMITDRPDATESANTLPKNYFQVETGGFFESFETSDYKTQVVGYNTTLFRYGMLENFEFRMGWSFEEGRTFVNNERDNNVNSGFSPLLLGMKVAIADENGLLPQIGLLGHLYLPFTASTDYRPETTGVDFRFAFSHTLSENSGLSYNLGAEWGNDSSEAAYIYSLSYARGLTEKLSAYVEVYGDFPENNGANHFCDAGFTYLLKNNIQLDATVGRSFTEGQDILVGAGVSFRLPN